MIEGLPTVPGFYWMRLRPGEWTIVRVSIEDGELHAEHINHLGEHPLAEGSARIIVGPIPTPDA
jgi:hypothetical protein